MLGTIKRILLHEMQRSLPGVLFRATVEETSRGPRLTDLKKSYGSSPEEDPASDHNWSKLVVPDRSCRAEARKGHDVQVVGVVHDTTPGWDSRTGVIFVEIQHSERYCVACVEQKMEDWCACAPNQSCEECGYESSRRTVKISVPKEDLYRYCVETLDRSYAFLSDLAFRFITETRGQDEFNEEVARILEKDHAKFHEFTMERRKSEEEAHLAVVRWAEQYWPAVETSADGEVDCWNGCGNVYLCVALHPNKTVSIWYHNPFLKGFVGEAFGVSPDAAYTLGLEDFYLTGNYLRNKDSDLGSITISPDGCVEVDPMCCPAL